VIEGVDNGSLQPESEFWLELDALGATGGYLVTADEPIAVATAYSGETTRVVSTASATPAVSWLIPISAAGPDSQTAIWILNATETPFSAEVTVFGGATTGIELPAGTTTGRVLAFNGRGGIVTATGPVAVFYGVITGGGAGSMTLGIPLG
jgi:hypothetical protein